MSSRPFRVGRSATGLGLFATKVIKRAAYIATYRGRRITIEAGAKRGVQIHVCTQQVMGDRRITAMECGSYINHACRPNAKPVGRRGGIVIVALRPIESGEEITYNYGREYVKTFLTEDGCRCTVCCRKNAPWRWRMCRPTKPRAGS